MTQTTDISGQVSELLALARQFWETAKLDEAEDILVTLNQVAPDQAAILRLLGLVAAAKGAYGPGAEALSVAAALQPADALLLNALSVCFFRLDRAEEALQAADRALALNGNFLDAWNSRGLALTRLGRSAEARAAFEHALTLAPFDAALYVNLAGALQALGLPDEALDGLDRAVALDAALPDAHLNRGNALRDLGRPAEALDAYDRAVALAPRLAAAHSSRGNLLFQLKRFGEAIASYGAALAIEPGLAAIQVNRGHCHLMLGQFAEGWRDFEARWAVPGALGPGRPLSMPRWRGEDLEGRAILLHCEQGMGDSLQFIRYAAAVKARGAHVVLESFQALAPLLRHADGVDQVIIRSDPLPALDFHLPLMSLPLVLGLAQPLAAAEPYLRVPAEEVAQWRQRLGAGDRLRIGLAVSGNPKNSNDEARSAPLAALAAALPAGPDYVLLQKEIREADRGTLQARPDIQVLGEALSSFLDTAAICQAMDLVISVDTSLAHLAGGLGRRVWVLLSDAADWRWSPIVGTKAWYPSAEVYRQQIAGSWSEPLAQLRRDLAALASARG